jgi:hypothetical protein
VLKTDFRQTRSLASPAKGSHFFLLVHP